MLVRPFKSFRRAFVRVPASMLGAVLAVICGTAASADTVLSFGAIPPGVILADQFQVRGVRFVPYDGKITASITPTSSGSVAVFNRCQGGAGCEFFDSGARAIFND